MCTSYLHIIVYFDSLCKPTLHKTIFYYCLCKYTLHKLKKCVLAHTSRASGAARQTSLPRAAHPSERFLFNREFRRNFLLNKKRQKPLPLPLISRYLLISPDYSALSQIIRGHFKSYLIAR